MKLNKNIFKLEEYNPERANYLPIRFVFSQKKITQLISHIPKVEKNRKEEKEILLLSNCFCTVIDFQVGIVGTFLKFHTCELLIINHLKSNISPLKKKLI